MTPLSLRAVLALLVAASALFASRAAAHTIGLSTGEYTARGASVIATLAFARAEVASLAPAIDDNRDGHLSPVEVDAARGILRSKILDRIRVTAGGAGCAPVITDAALTEQDGLLVTGRWDCKTWGDPFEVEMSLLDDLARGHRHVARAVAGGATHDEVLYGARRTFVVGAPTGEGRGDERVEAGTAGGTSPGPAGSHELGSFFGMGIEHILTGYDHLVFILGLVLARARLRPLLLVVTAFTVGHSVSLALAALGALAPSSRIIEPAIALSIVYVGIENFFVEDASKRWRIALPFGFVHGFGFAGALREAALPASSVPAALVSFNLGVEAGQLAVLAVFLPLVFFLRRTSWFEPSGVRVASGAVVLAGGVWFLVRAFGG